MASGFKTGGRKKGGRNRKTVLLEEKGREALAKVLGANAFEGDAHSLLIAVYKDESRPIELRLEAAKAAIRFEKPALAAVDTHGTIENVHYAIGDRPLTEDEWIERHTKTH
jgi:DNA-binding PadR family transcriptional regulator